VELTPKRQKLADAYIKNGGVIKDAAKVAGVSASYASKVIKEDPDVRDYIAGHMLAASKETQLTVQEVLDSLSYAKEIALVGTPTAHGTKVEIGSYLKATEMQGRYLGMWVDNMNISETGHGALMAKIKDRQGQ